MREVQVAGWVLLHFVWQGALVGLVTAAGLRMLRSASATTRYLVTCAALAMMMAAPTVTARLLLTAARASEQATASSFVRANDTVLRAETPAAWHAQAPSGLSLHTVRLSLDALIPVLVSAWFAGVALLLLRLAGGWWRVRRLHLDALALAFSRWQAMSDRLASRLGVPCRVHVVDSPRVDTPTVLGWLRPVILLPVAALANLAPAQVEAVLAHELAHIRRHDYLVNLLQTLAETLLFYHPAVWWVSSRIRAERENCCDDVAVNVCGDALDYAAALTELETWRTTRATFALAATDGSLLARVRRVLRVKVEDGRSSPSIGLIAALVIVLSITVGATMRSAGPAQTPSTSPNTGRQAFEVVSIKPVLPTMPGGAWRNAPGRITGTFSVKTLIALAFSTPSTPVMTPFPANEIVGGPDWLDTARFAINATAPLDGLTNTTNPIAFGRPLAPLLRSLLEDRFMLAAHVEKREVPVYALVVARSDGRLGPRLRQVTDDECAARRLKVTNGTLTSSDPRPCGGLLPTPTGFKMFGAPMTRIASQLQGRGAAKPILDGTKIAGNFDVDFQSDPETSFFTAVQEQLGLKFESRREPLDVLIVDHVEHPTED